MNFFISSVLGGCIGAFIGNCLYFYFFGGP